MIATGKNRRMLQLAGGLLVAGLLLAAPAGCPGRPPRGGTEQAAADATAVIEFDPPVQEILGRKLASLGSLVQDPGVVAAVREAGGTDAGGDSPSARQIQDWDRAWIAAGEESPLVAGRLRSPLARKLVAFRNAHPEFVELCLTDARGLLAAATNKTSDFFQADEPWWTAGYAGGSPLCFEIEYDASSRSEGISLVAPVRDPATGETLGVLKAVCAVAAVKAEL